MAKKKPATADAAESPSYFDRLVASRKLPRDPVNPEPSIPTVRVRREWPYFNEDADTESLDNVISDVIGLWWKIDRSDTGIDAVEYFGPTAEFWIDRDAEPLDLYRDGTGDARIAIANYKHLHKCWQELLSKPCWSGITTFPPVKVFARLIDEQLDTGAVTDAYCAVRFDRDHERGIRFLTDAISKCRQIVAPTAALFFASLEALGVYDRASNGSLPKERDDTPTAADVENGRRVLASMGINNPTVEAFRGACRKAGVKGSNLKLGLIFRESQK